MLAQHKELIYKHFPELVANCNLVKVIRNIPFEEFLENKIASNVGFEDDSRHNNRLILFNLLKSNSDTVFYHFTQSLKECDYHDIAHKLENKQSIATPRLYEPRKQTLLQRELIKLVTFLMVIFMKIFPTTL